MARHKEFDREEALQKAMEIFWRRGYEATSIQDLVEHMGINRQSIYDTFGDKHALYLAALDRYREQSAAQFVELLEGPGSLKKSLRRLFDSVIDEATTDESRRGCFMANATMELAAGCTETATRAETNLQHVERAFEGALKRAQGAGEIASGRSPRSLARFLFNNLVGLRVMAKTTRDRRVLEDIMRVTLSVLD